MEADLPTTELKQLESISKCNDIFFQFLSWSEWKAKENYITCDAFCRHFVTERRILIHWLQIYSLIYHVALTLAEISILHQFTTPWTNSFIPLCNYSVTRRKLKDLSKTKRRKLKER